jgi:hypothetical protein
VLTVFKMAGNVGRLAVRWRLELQNFQTITTDE